MLAAIIANLQNVQPRPVPVPLPPQSGGRSNILYYLADYTRAVNSFVELPNETPNETALRRLEHISREIEHGRSERSRVDQAMAAGLVWGAALEQRRAADEIQGTLEEFEAAYANLRVKLEAAQQAQIKAESERHQAQIIAARAMASSRRDRGIAIAAIALVAITLLRART